MKTFVIDIETIPSQIEAIKDDLRASAVQEVAELMPPKNYKKPEAIAEWESAKREEIMGGIDEKYLKLSFDGAANHIVCIGVQIDGGGRIAFIGDGKDALADEVNILTQFFGFLGEHVKGSMPATFVGHNIIGFDLKIIRQRSIVLGIKPPYCLPMNAKPWDTNPFDTMMQWDARNFVSLDKICKALGLPGKGDVNGGDVYAMWQAGKIAEIAEYCLQDVDKTLAVYKRMTFQS